MKRKLAFVTNARSDYSIMYPLMKEAVLDKEIEAQIFCGGMHLKLQFGNTWKQLEADGIPITEKIDYFVDDDSALGLADSMSRGVNAFAGAIAKHTPDIVVACGDRIENLALFTAATSLRQPLAHMCGGDITEGAFDNQVRHAMTKLAHLHFVAIDEHAKRVIQMGEEPWRVTVTGGTAIDTIMQLRPLSRAELHAQAGVPADGAIVISTFHPQTLGSDDSVAQYKNLLTVLAETKATPVLSYPNIDPGFAPLIKLLEEFHAKRPDAIVSKSFTREQYYSLLHHSSMMIGNSSSGLWEAPSFALPVVNIGARQSGRLRAENVIDVSGDDVNELRSAVAKAMSPEFKNSLKGLKNPYGHGGASELILNALKAAPLGDKLMIKKFHEMA